MSILLDGTPGLIFISTFWEERLTCAIQHNRHNNLCRNRNPGNHQKSEAMVFIPKVSNLKLISKTCLLKLETFHTIGFSVFSLV